MMYRSARLALAALALAAAGGCERPAPLDPAPAPAAPRADLLDPVTGLLTGTLRLLTCEDAPALSATGTIGPDGGTISAGGYRVDFPAGAVPIPQTFALSVPAGSNVELDVRAEGYEHYWFAVPVTVTLDASRCGVLPSGLQVWNVDETTKAPLQEMDGVLVDALTGAVRFRTPHFSGYTIAW